MKRASLQLLGRFNGKGIFEWTQASCNPTGSHRETGSHRDETILKLRYLARSIKREIPASSQILHDYGFRLSTEPLQSKTIFEKSKYEKSQ